MHFEKSAGTVGAGDLVLAKNGAAGDIAVDCRVVSDLADGSDGDRVSSGFDDDFNADDGDRAACGF